MKELTKQNLLDLGLEVTIVGDNEYAVHRRWKGIGRTDKVEYKDIKISLAKGSHKYGETKYYPIIVVSCGNKNKTITLSRLVYAWFIGDIPANIDVDHIDSDTFNNRLENLQLLTRAENLKKRRKTQQEITTKLWQDRKAMENK